MGDLALGSSLTILALYIFIHTRGFPDARLIQYDASLLPRICASLILFSGVMLIIGNLKDSKEFKDFNLREFLRANSKPFLIVVVMALCLLLWYSIGFVLSTILLLFIMIIIYKGDKKKGAIMAVVVSISIFLLFRMAFQVPLPRIGLWIF